MSSVENLIQQANDLINDGNYKEAIPVFQKILEVDQGNKEILYLFAMTNVELENFDEAEKLLYKLLDIDDEDTETLLQLGYLTHQSGNVKKSKDLFHKIVEIDPENADAYQMLGLMAMDDGDYQSAVNYLQASFANEEDYEVYLNIVESYLEIDELEKAFEMLENLDTKKLDMESHEIYDNLRSEYFLAKALESWSGTKIDENSDKVYFPTNLKELEDGVHFVKMAKIQESKDHDIIERIEVFEEVLQTNREKLDNSQTTENTKASDKKKTTETSSSLSEND